MKSGENLYYNAHHNLFLYEPRIFGRKEYEVYTHGEKEEEAETETTLNS